jgi:hypothetical protein
MTTRAQVSPGPRDPDPARLRRVHGGGDGAMRGGREYRLRGVLFRVGKCAGLVAGERHAARDQCVPVGEQAGGLVLAGGGAAPVAAGSWAWPMQGLPVR